MSGFTLSHRDKWNHPSFKNLLEAAIWGWMCDTAVWKDTNIMLGDSLFKLKRGQLVTTIGFISKGFCIGDRATRTFVEKLEICGMIDKQTTNKGTIITICNYDEYQLSPKTDNTPTDKQPTNSRQTADNNKNKDNKNNEVNKVKKVPIDVVIPDWMPKEEWDDFMEIRAAKKKPIVGVAIKTLVSKLTEYRELGMNPKDVLQQAIVGNWTSVWELKNFNSNQKSFLPPPEPVSTRPNMRDPEYRKSRGLEPLQ